VCTYAEPGGCVCRCAAGHVSLCSRAAGPAPHSSMAPPEPCASALPTPAGTTRRSRHSDSGLAGIPEDGVPDDEGSSGSWEEASEEEEEEEEEGVWVPGQVRPL
jgi:hypothetical protein